VYIFLGSLLALSINIDTPTRATVTNEMIVVPTKVSYAIHRFSTLNWILMNKDNQLSTSAIPIHARDINIVIMD